MRKVAAALLFLHCACSPGPAPRPLLASVGLPAPELRLDRLIPGPPAAVRGWGHLAERAAVLTFWAPRCAACPEELAAREALAARFAGRGLIFIHVTDAGAEEASGYFSGPGRAGHLAPGAGPELFTAFRVYDLPCTVLVTSSAEVYAFAGPGALTEELLSGLLAGAPPPGGEYGQDACRPRAAEGR